jgi:glycine hydroxymethyltransferase
MGQDFENPFGITTPKGEVRMMSSLIDAAIFPGVQGGPLEHVIAAKAVAFGEALSDEFFHYILQVQKNAKVLAAALMDKGFNIVSGGTNNHLMLIDLRNKGVSGKAAEAALGKAHITVNKNMVPFDDKSPFVTSGIRIGTPAVTSRGLKEAEMAHVADFIDRAIQNTTDDAALAAIGKEVVALMGERPLFV